MSGKEFESLIIKKTRLEAYKMCLNDLLNLEKKIPIYQELKDLIKKYRGLLP